MAICSVELHTTRVQVLPNKQNEAPERDLSDLARVTTRTDAVNIRQNSTA